MNSNIYLIGAEDVRAGGHAAERGGDAMRSAAGEFSEAVRVLAFALENNQAFMRDWLEKYEKVTKEAATINHTGAPR